MNLNAKSLSSVIADSLKLLPLIAFMIASIDTGSVTNFPQCLQVKPILPLIPFVSPSSGVESVPSMSGPKRKAGSPLRETEVLTDDNHLGLVTVEIVAGDEGSKVNAKV